VMLLAGLLYLCGAVAEPLVHAPAGAVAVAGGLAWVGSGDGPIESGSSPHADAPCLLCEAASPFWRPAITPGIAEPIVLAPARAFAAGTIRAPPAFPSSKPRAPPLA
jgi:hypothetical protein